MDQAEPPSSSSLLLIGKDSHNNWVVQDPRGLRGGLFVDRAEALRYALFENGHRPQAVIMVPGILELDMSRKPRLSPNRSEPSCIALTTCAFSTN